MAQNLHGGKYGQGYDTVDDAAEAATMNLGWQPRVTGQEYMTMIFKNPDDGKYYRSDFQTEGNRDTSSWAGSLPGKVVAIVHSHPQRGPSDAYPMTNFSNADINTSRALTQKEGYSVPNYIAAMTGAIRGWPSTDLKYTPGENNEVPQGRGAGQKMSPGNPYLAAFPIDEFIQHIERTSPMGDTVQHSPAITAAQRKAMVEAVVNAAQERGMQPMPSPPDFTRPHAMDMGGAPRPLPPGMNTFGSPMGVPPVTGQSPEAERAALIAALRARGMQQ